MDLCDRHFASSTDRGRPSLIVNLSSVVSDRLIFGRLLGFAIVIMALISAPPDAETGSIHRAIVSGFSLFLVCMAAFGRVWATLFLGGKKNSALVREGAFSLCRNPLYFFTALGALGVALESHQVLTVLAVTGFLLVYYSAQIKREERQLVGLFGPAYSDYMRTTPRFLPRLSRYWAPPHITVYPSLVYKAIRDNLWWLVVWFIVHESDMLNMRLVALPDRTWF